MITSGVRDFDVARRFPSPQDITLNDFATQRPRDGWYHITNAVAPIELAVGSYRTVYGMKEDGSKKIYLPVLAPGDIPDTGYAVRSDAPVYVIMHLTDPDALTLETEMHEVSTGRDPAAMDAFRQQNRVPLLITDSIVGTVHAPTAAEVSHVEHLIGNVAPNYVVLEQGAKPAVSGTRSFWMGIALVVLIPAAWIAWFLHWQRTVSTMPYDSRADAGSFRPSYAPRPSEVVEVPSAPGDTIAMPTSELPPPGSSKNAR
jgi:hypothetical protein